MKKKVIMIDGVFDPIHEGHIKYIEEASKLGNYLVLNNANDSEIWSKRPLIGPLLNEKSRILVLQGLKFIDEVVCLDTPLALSKVNPDVYVKGIDWKDKLPQNEIDICKKNKISLAYLNTKMNSSSDQLIRFLKQQKT
jgi:D-glycero-beta-D-manno-heptose 1-phosphate adenylyltransferase